MAIIGQYGCNFYKLCQHGNVSKWVGFLGNGRRRQWVRCLKDWAAVTSCYEDWMEHHPPSRRQEKAGFVGGDMKLITLQSSFYPVNPGAGGTTFGPWIPVQWLNSGECNYSRHMVEQSAYGWIIVNTEERGNEWPAVDKVIIDRIHGQFRSSDRCRIFSWVIALNLDPVRTESVHIQWLIKHPVNIQWLSESVSHSEWSKQWLTGCPVRRAKVGALPLTPPLTLSNQRPDWWTDFDPYFCLLEHFLFRRQFAIKGQLVGETYDNKQLIFCIDPSQAWQRSFLDNLGLFGPWITATHHRLKIQGRRRKAENFPIWFSNSMNVIVFSDIYLRSCQIAKGEFLSPHLWRRLVCQKQTRISLAVCCKETLIPDM